MDHNVRLVFQHADILKEKEGYYKSDTDKMIRFYEQDHYYMSNFSSFNVELKAKLVLPNGGIIRETVRFQTSEHAYHWCRFYGYNAAHASAILQTRSAHEAFVYAQHHKRDQNPIWDKRKLFVMECIVSCKIQQHEYIQHKLTQVNDRRLVEDSWRDGYWGWGSDREGNNYLGRIWESQSSLFLHDQLPEVPYLDFPLLTYEK